MAIGDKKPVVMEADLAVPGGVATLDADGKLAEGQRPVGVNSFNGRTGDVVPAAGDYTAAQVGAYTVKEVIALLAEKAPAGYGLGSYSRKLTSADDLDQVMLSGWYYFETADLPQNAPTYFSRALMRVDGLSAGIFRQTLYFANAAIQAGNAGSCVVRSIYSYTPSEWEYVNPPLNVGVEYRTTERYLQKPVYTKLIASGTIPAGSSVTLEIADNIQHIVFADCYGISTTQYNNLSVVYVSGARPSGVVLQNAGSADRSNYYVLVRYTKTSN